MRAYRARRGSEGTRGRAVINYWALLLGFLFWQWDKQRCVGRMPALRYEQACLLHGSWFHIVRYSKSTRHVPKITRLVSKSRD